MLARQVLELCFELRESCVCESGIATHDEGDSHHGEGGAGDEASLSGQLCDLNA